MVGGKGEQRPLAVQHRALQGLAVHGPNVLHLVHLEPLRDQHRPLLGHRVAVRAPHGADPVSRQVCRARRLVLLPHRLRPHYGRRCLETPRPAHFVTLLLHPDRDHRPRLPHHLCRRDESAPAASKPGSSFFSSTYIVPGFCEVRFLLLRLKVPMKRKLNLSFLKENLK